MPIKELAKFLVVNGMFMTTSGNYIYDKDELFQMFRVDVDLEQLRDELYLLEEVAEVDIEDDYYISIYFYTMYCPNVEDEEEDEE